MPDPENRFKQLLGLATKAGAVVSGEFAVEQAIRKGEVFLVIIARDASENTKKHFRDMCAYRQVPILFALEKSELGRYTGKEQRASAGLLNKGFADKLISIKREG
ncbi:MAG: ribosomal L7Ae/L30e/S12e/Gadd45 family protein [Parasporobacterium sp.]|nr:ribosomal L7Ae/L30e/S12e/Gadd45 family protein [Parasporobacterium sp.]